MSLLIKIEHLSEDPEIRELRKFFWELEGRKFTHTIEELGLRFGIHRTQVPKTVFANSRAFFAEYTCRVDFKRRILNEVRLPLRVMGRQDLIDPENG
ncbi:MAG: hypothetical protein P8184_12675 [Calditrichia bacterium]